MTTGAGGGGALGGAAATCGRDGQGTAATGETGRAVRGRAGCVRYRAAGGRVYGRRRVWAAWN